MIDLGRKLGLAPDANPGPRPNIVIVEVEVAAGAEIAAGSEVATGTEAASGRRPLLAGFMADRVCDVVVYRSRDLQKGVLRGEGRPRKLIDLARWVTEDVVAGLSSSSPLALQPVRSQPLSPSKACSISRLASGEMAVSGKRGGPP